jgi:hypothetical protein
VQATLLFSFKDDKQIYVCVFIESVSLIVRVSGVYRLGNRVGSSSGVCASTATLDAISE